MKLFLWADGAIVVAGLLFFLLLLIRRNSNPSNFRDDLWAEKKKREAEDLVDKKILLEHRPDPKDKLEAEKPLPQAKKEEFQVPNFRGKSHEILGIPFGSSKELVLRAYKHWIKRYHPDRVSHLGAKYVEQARRRAEQLNTARDELVKSSGKP